MASTTPDLRSQPIALGGIWAVTLVGIGALLTAGVSPIPTVLGLLAGIALTGIITFAAARSPGGRLIASGLTVIAGVLVVGTVGAAVVTSRGSDGMLIAVLVAFLCILVGWGASGVATGALSRASERSAVGILLATILPILAYAILLSPWTLALLDEEVGGTADGALGAGVGDVTGMGDDVSAIVVLVVSVIVLLGSIIVTVPRLTILSLLPTTAREPLQDGLARLRDWSMAAITIGVLSTVVGMGAWVGLEILREARPEAAEQVMSVIEVMIDIAVTLGESSTVMWLLLGVAGIFWAGLLASLIPAIPRLRHHSLARWVPPIAGGVTIAAVVHVMYPRLFHRQIEPALAGVHSDHPVVPEALVRTGITGGELLELLTPPGGNAIGAAVVLVLILTVLIVIVGVWMASALGIIRERGNAGSVAGGALITAALLVGLEGAALLTISVPVVAGIVIWDLTRYAEGVVEELGRPGVTVIPILAHGLASLAVGGVLVGGAMAVANQPPIVDLAVVVPAVVLLLVAIASSFAALKHRSHRLATR